MTDNEQNDVAVELRKINTALGGLIASQAAHGRELAEIKQRVKETNGRVTALEAVKIADDAITEDRQRRNELIGRRATDLNTHKFRLQDRAIGSGVTIVAVIVGAILADVRWF